MIYMKSGMKRCSLAMWLLFAASHGSSTLASPYVFSARTSYVTIPNPSGGSSFRSESSIPQIEHLSTPTSIAWSDAEAWNALIAKHIGGPEKSSVCAGGRGDIYKKSNVDIASVLLIGVTVERSDQCHITMPTYPGTENDSYRRETHYNIVMMRSAVRDLEPEDLFSRGDDWKRVLTEHLESEAKESMRRYEWHPPAEAMKSFATDPSNWIIGSNAFGIRVNKGDLAAPDTMDAFTVTIPWKDLQSVLSFKGKRILNARNW